MQVQGTLTAVLALISFTTGVEATGLKKTLGLDRRVGFVTRPDLVTSSYLKPIETIVVPCEIAIPLQAVNEGLTFYAAYRARNYKAMAAVGAMSIWGGTLRRGINAVSGVNGPKKATIEDLSKLTDREIEILGYLWRQDWRTDHELYRDVGYVGRWKDLSEVLDRMEKQYLIGMTRAGTQTLYHAEVTQLAVRRAALVSRKVDLITTVLEVIRQLEVGTTRVEPNSESESARDGFEAQ